MRLVVLAWCLLVACGSRSGLAIGADAAPVDARVGPRDAAPIARDAPGPDVPAAIDCDGTGRWVIHDAPTDEDLSDVVVIGAADAWISGGRGTILHWDGAAWTPVATDTSEDVGAIWIDGGDGWAIARRALLRRSGDRWRTVEGPTIPRDSILSAVWGTGPDDVWVGGGTAGSPHEELWHWDGAAWERHERAVVDIQVVSLRGAASDRALWMLGHLGRVARRTGPSTWERVIEPPGETAAGLWPVGADEVWAAAARGEVHHFRAGAWESFSAGDRERYFYAIWGSSSADVWALGYQGSASHYDGALWSAVELPTRATIAAIDGTCATDAWAVGEAGTILRLVR